MSERKRLLFIYNPHSGRGQVNANLPKILDTFCSSQYEVIVHATTGPNDATQIAKEYTAEGKADRIVSAGGDGTLDEVANGVMQGKIISGHDVPIGVISVGSANDFGFSLGIPNDIVKAAEKAVSGSEFSCDIAKFNDRYFTYTAAFGMMAEVSFETPQEIKNTLGYAAYILDGMTRLSELKSVHAKVTFDGQTVEDDYLIGMVVSSKSIGGLRGITGDEVALNDGVHELMLLKAPKKIGDLGKAVNEIVTHKFDGQYLNVFKARNVHFEFDNEVAWSLDGENGGLWKEADINVINKGITYVI